MGRYSEETLQLMRESQIKRYERPGEREKHCKKPREIPQEILESEKLREKFKGMKIPKSKSVCKIIKTHHTLLNDDPERLSTDFIKQIINISEDCNAKKRRIRTPSKL